jgi:pimeloyl-ACP methyl ester carboxylesterase
MAAVRKSEDAMPSATGNRCPFVLGAVGAMVAALWVPAAVAAPQLVREELQIASVDGVSIHVRTVRQAHRGARDRREPIILIHGARVPGVASFDLAVPSGSFAGDLALRLDRAVYIMDARGYGGSDRPAAMSQPASENRPLSRAYEVIRDITAVVEKATHRERVSRVSLIGWATGGAWAAFYASLWPERVGHLITLNALYGAASAHPVLGPESSSADPKRPDQLNPTVGAYSLNVGASLLSVWDRSIPATNKATWRDPVVAAAYVAAALESDPQSRERNPPAFRAPMGAIEDSFYQAAGRRLFDASSITARTLIVHSELDFWSRPEDASEFLHDAVHAQSARVLEIPGATHFVHLDRPDHGRDVLLGEVVRFLEDCADSPR